MWRWRGPRRTSSTSCTPPTRACSICSVSATCSAPPEFAVDPAHWERVPDTTAPLYRNRREQPRAALVDGYVARHRRRPPPPARRRDRRAPRRAPRSGSRRSPIVPSAPRAPTRSAPRASPRTSTSTSRSTPTRRDAACSCCPTRGSPAGARPSTAHPPRSRAPTSPSAPSRAARPASRGLRLRAGVVPDRCGDRRRGAAVHRGLDGARRAPPTVRARLAPRSVPRSSRRCGPTFPAHHDSRGPVLAQRGQHALPDRRVR